MKSIKFIRKLEKLPFYDPIEIRLEIHSLEDSKKPQNQNYVISNNKHLKLIKIVVNFANCEYANELTAAKQILIPRDSRRIFIKLDVCILLCLEQRLNLNQWKATAQETSVAYVIRSWKQLKWLKFVATLAFWSACHYVCSESVRLK